MPPLPINRRAAVRRITAALGGVISAPTLSALLAGCRVESTAEAYVPRTLSPRQFRLVRLIAEHIIPETGTPGAAAAGVDAFVDMTLTDFYPEARREQFLRQLQLLDERALSLFGESFSDGTPEEQTRLLRVLDAEAYPDPATEPDRYDAVQTRIARDDIPLFRTMKELTIAGYYTSEVGQTQELHLPPFGEYRADIPFEEVARAWA